MDYEDIGEKGKTMVVITSIDSFVSVWIRETPEKPFELVEKTTLVNEPAETSALSFLPGKKTPILALGGVGGSGNCRGSHILLFLQKNNKFEHLQTLKGHQDWIRCLSFVSISPQIPSTVSHSASEEYILLASSSQDKFIRLWKIELNNSNDKPSESSPSDASSFLSSLKLLESLDTSLNQQSFSFFHEDSQYSLLLESVLCAHEDCNYSPFFLLFFFPFLNNLNPRITFHASLIPYYAFHSPLNLNFA